ncbi:Uma2 family endonuclease [Pendulispora brunnea]|uniref:Uma2 family endonuclease n=1 Tax=Pendulispora brunnea TaxID=2905690 RepID=A0ABZ2KKW1_9BACT
MSQRLRYQVDPADPRAPSMEIWEQLTPAERTRVVAELPAEVPWELMPPEGDAHRKAKERSVDALDGFFRKVGRRVYVSAELAVFYPNEPRFSPDLLAVLDVEHHDRSKWVVAAEGKGLDLVIEVVWEGSEKKDYEFNVSRYARLGTAEYFIYDRKRGRLVGYRLPSSDAKTYQPIVPQGGRWSSQVLGLDLALEAERVRFYYGNAPLPESAELAARTENLLNEAILRKEESDQRAEEEAQRADQEAARARRAEEELASVRAELERLKRERL